MQGPNQYIGAGRVQDAGRRGAVVLSVQPVFSHSRCSYPPLFCLVDTLRDMSLRRRCAMKSLNFEKAMEAAGYGRFQRRLLWICGAGWAADAMEVLLVSFALPAMAAEWNLTAPQKSLLATAIFIGMLVGALVWGRLADRMGRKLGFIATIGIDSFFGLLSAFAPSFGILVVLRTLTGFGVGGTLPVDYGMFTEYLPVKDRGKRLVLLESFWALGTIIAAGTAWLVVPTLGWRWLFAISALPGLLLYIVRRYIPESPRFLFMKGKQEAAIAVLETVARQNGRSSEFALFLESAGGTRESAVPDDPAPVQGSVANLPVQAKRTGASELFAPEFIRTTILLWAVWFLISLGYYGTFTWLPSWFRTKGFSLLAVYPNTFVMALAQLPGYFSAAWLVEKIGRRKTLAIYLGSSGVFVWLFSLASSPVAVLVTAIWLSFFALGSWGALYAYTPEVYPTRLRATGMGAASGMTRIAGAIAPSIGILVSGASLTVPLAIFALSYCTAALASALLPVETRGCNLE